MHAVVVLVKFYLNMVDPSNTTRHASKPGLQKCVSVSSAPYFYDLFI